MTYEITSNMMLFEMDRTAIADIAIGDTLRAQDLPDAEYTWTLHDSQFLESNPDARLFLKVQKLSDKQYKGMGVMIIPE
jgi:hypothetical protein